jgi:catalase
MENPRYLEPPLKISGDADRYNPREGADDFAQPGALFRLMNASQKNQLFSNLAAAMQGVPERIQVRQLVHFYKADPAYGRGVAKKLGLDMAKFAPWVKLSLKELIEKTSEENYGQ